MAGQEMLTADGLSVKLALFARCRVGDPRLWHEAVAAPDAFVYAALQVALRHREFYELERRLTKDYPLLRKVWVRTGKRSGGMSHWGEV